MSPFYLVKVGQALGSPRLQGEAKSWLAASPPGLGLAGGGGGRGGGASLIRGQ